MELHTWEHEGIPSLGSQGSRCGVLQSVLLWQVRGLILKLRDKTEAAWTAGSLHRGQLSWGQLQAVRECQK